jgi:hypothetical protein
MIKWILLGLTLFLGTVWILEWLDARRKSKRKG